MREFDGQKQITGSGADNCAAARETAQSVLRNHADRLRRQAGELHKEADRVDLLANASAGLTGPAEEALWRLAIDGISRIAPRLF